VELEQNLDRIRKQGLGLAAISYDSVAVLKNFAERRHIAFPLLSDPESKIIRAFGILNETVKPGTPQFGIPNPGTFVLDAKGRVVAKYFEEDIRERVSSSDILVRQFGALADEASASVETNHLRLATAASTAVARPGHRIALSLELDLKPSMHVYAPGVEGYIPIEWKLEESPAAKAQLAEVAPEGHRRDGAGISRARADHAGDHFRAGKRREAAGHPRGRADRQRIIAVPGLRRPEMLSAGNGPAGVALPF